MTINGIKIKPNVLSLHNRAREPKKRKLVVNDNQLTVYLENGKAAEPLSDTYKTEAIAISLDKIFTFDAEWF